MCHKSYFNWYRTEEDEKQKWGKEVGGGGGEVWPSSLPNLEIAKKFIYNK